MMNKPTFKEIFERGVWCKLDPVTPPVFYDFNFAGIGKQMIIGVNKYGKEYFYGSFNRCYFLEDFNKTFAFDIFDFEEVDINVFANSHSL